MALTPKKLRELKVWCYRCKLLDLGRDRTKFCSTLVELDKFSSQKISAFRRSLFPYLIQIGYVTGASRYELIE